MSRTWVCLALLVAAVGCSGGDDPRVAVSGVLALVGGPAGAAPDAAPGRVAFVRVGGEGGTVSVPADADGSFSLRLEPGRYTVTGTSPRYGESGGLCRAAGAVLVRAGMAPVQVLCQRR